MELSPLAKGIALAEGFDLDDLGAELGHQAGGEGGCDQRAYLKDPDPGKRGSHARYLLFLESGPRLKSTGETIQPSVGNYLSRNAKGRVWPL
ncbi:hypothetical protein D3C84_703830 [compost metagenome]